MPQAAPRPSNDLYAPPSPDEIQSAVSGDSAFIAPPSQEEIAAAGQDKSRAGLFSEMDRLAQKSGNQNWADEIAKQGHAVMGGQIAALAGPAGRIQYASAAAPEAGAASESAPVIERFSRSASNATPAADPSKAQKALSLLEKIPGAKKYLAGAGLLGAGAAAKTLWEHRDDVANAGAWGVQMAAGLVSPPSTSGTVGPYSLKGEDKWAVNGLQNLVQHNGSGGLQNEAAIDRMFASPKARQLLIQASDLKPGSKAMQKVYDQLQGELGGNP